MNLNGLGVALFTKCGWPGGSSDLSDQQVQAMNFGGLGFHLYGLWPADENRRSKSPANVIIMGAWTSEAKDWVTMKIWLAYGRAGGLSGRQVKGS